MLLIKHSFKQMKKIKYESNKINKRKTNKINETNIKTLHLA